MIAKACAICSINTTNNYKSTLRSAPANKSTPRFDVSDLCAEYGWLRARTELRMNEVAAFFLPGAAAPTGGVGRPDQ